MNSAERKEARYQRRMQKRRRIIEARSNFYSPLEDAFVFHKVLYYADKCTLGVKWKRSTKFFMFHEFTIVSSCCHNIKHGTYKTNKTHTFEIYERGKRRKIDAPHINDRLVHKVLANEILIPIYLPHSVYDNGASQKGKGYSFAINRLKNKMRKFYKKYGLNGYVALIDYSKFFENCSHEIIHKLHEKFIINPKTIKVIEDYLFIGKGLALGIELAQIEAGMFPYLLDHYVENNNGYLIRYMDDSFFISKTKEEAIKILDEYLLLSKRLKIVINKDKTQIVKLSDYFLFCKWRFFMDENGYIKNIPCKSNIYRQRRKLRKMYKLRLISKTTFYEIRQTKEAFISYLKTGNGYKYIKYLEKMPE